MKKILLPWSILKPMFLHSLNTFEGLLGKGELRKLLLILAGLILFWHIYTPIHELLHVAACFLGGGTVEELALKPQYGGTLLARIFPFVVPESDYAGQLTGFQVPNDGVYALVDFAPYLLSLFGLALIECCRRRGLGFLFGLAVILTYIPLMSIPGDYYEAASLVTTRIAEKSDDQRPKGFLVSDDVFRSIGDFKESGRLDAEVGFLIGLGLFLAIYLALVTLAIQVRIAGWIFKGPIFPDPNPAPPAQAGPSSPTTTTPDLPD